MSLLQHLPLGSEVIPARFMSFLWLLVAVAVGLIINELLVTHQGRVAVSSLRTVVAWGAIVLGLFFVAPSSMNDRWTPPHQAALTSSRFAALVPSGSVVLTYPYASAINSEAMTDLALAANRYRLIGGRAMVPSPGTGKSQSIAPLAPFGVFNTFLHAQFSTAELGFAQLALNQPVGTADTDAQFHVDLIRFISRYHVTDVVATPTGPGASHIRVLLTSTLGAPQRVGRVWVWVVRPSSIH